MLQQLCSIAVLIRKKKDNHMILVDAQGKRSDTYMTGKSLQINIVVDSYSKLNSAKYNLIEGKRDKIVAISVAGNKKKLIH